MRLATVSVAGRPTVALATERGLIDLRASAEGMESDFTWASASLRELIEGGAPAREFLDRVATSVATHVLVPDDHTYLPPILDPPRIFCIGRNYADHAEEGGAAVPDYPMIFLKPATSLVGHEGHVLVPPSTDQVDWEGELAVVIGIAGRDIPEADAWTHVIGVTVANDLTARDWQRRTSQFDAGKMFDGFGPMGPLLVTTDELVDIESLALVTRVNGETMQTGVVRQMVFPIPRLISYISQAVKLLPGDVILTGTPSGVGYARTPPVFLGHGDVVEVSVDGVGELRSHIRLQKCADAVPPTDAAQPSWEERHEA